MKKLLLAVIMLAGINSWAQFGTQYSTGDFYILTTQYGGHNLKTTSDTNLSITRLSTTGYDSFGYFTFDSSALPSSGSSLDLKTLTFDSAGVANIGNLSANTNVGFWMTTAKGTTYSIQSLNKNYFYASKGYEYTSTGEPILRMGTYENYSLDNIRYTVEGGPAKPTGQPLPGVLISAFLGLASLAGWKFGRKKS